MSTLLDRRLLAAAEHDDHEGVASALTLGACVNAVGVHGETALFWACERGEALSCRLLLRHGAGVEARDEPGWTPLMVASFHGHTECAEAVLDYGALLEARQSDGATALIFAAARGRTELVRLLLSRGADRGARDASSLSALDHAEREGHAGVVRLLGGVPLASPSDANALKPPLWSLLSRCIGHEGIAGVAVLSVLLLAVGSGWRRSRSVMKSDAATSAIHRAAVPDLGGLYAVAQRYPVRSRRPKHHPST
jgi:hypothetical protein